ncbi:MAG: 3-hydroxyacyl-ACP dehydratase FabZ family protein, partial [Planctomycetota bacterium]
MPPEPIIDMSRIDPEKVLISREEIYQVNPHRYEFQQIEGIYFIDHDEKEIAGYRDLREDEFWVRGHIPGRPIFPG